MIDSYKTVKEPVQAQIKVQRSKFIATVFPCLSKEDAESEIEKIAKQYYDANHNCFAYRLWSDTSEEIFRYSDAGEPSGTAGRPIYDTLCSFELYNAGVVVTRYFGGIKLGTGGLARAYKDTVSEVLNNAEIIEQLITEKYRIEFAHNLTSIILRVLSEDGININESKYTDVGEILFEVRRSKIKHILDLLRSKTNAKAKISKI